MAISMPSGLVFDTQHLLGTVQDLWKSLGYDFTLLFWMKILKTVPVGALAFANVFTLFTAVANWYWVYHWLNRTGIYGISKTKEIWHPESVGSGVLNITSCYPEFIILDCMNVLAISLAQMRASGSTPCVSTTVVHECCLVHNTIAITITLLAVGARRSGAASADSVEVVFAE